MKRETKANIVIGIVLLVIFVSLFTFLGFHCKDYKKTISCLKPIAEEYCNNRNATSISFLLSEDTCGVSLPRTFTCGTKYEERQVGYKDITHYEFLQEEWDKCVKTSKGEEDGK